VRQNGKEVIKTSEVLVCNEIFVSGRLGCCANVVSTFAALAEHVNKRLRYVEYSIVQTASVQSALIN